MGYSVQDLRRVRVPKIHYPALAAPTSANPSVNHLSVLIVGNPLAACRTEALRLNAESDFAVAGFRLALDRTLIPV